MNGKWLWRVVVFVLLATIVAGCARTWRVMEVRKSGFLKGHYGQLTVGDPKKHEGATIDCLFTQRRTAWCGRRTFSSKSQETPIQRLVWILFGTLVCYALVATHGASLSFFRNFCFLERSTCQH